MSPRSKPAALLIAALLMVPAAAGFFTDHDARSRWEKRKLENLEGIDSSSTLTEIFSILDDYINDHIGFVRTVNQRYRSFQYHVFRDAPIPNVDLGPDGFLLLNAPSTKHPYARLEKLCKYEPGAVAEATARVKQLLYSADAANIQAHVAVVPSKLVLYGDRLPQTVPARLRKACSGQKPDESIAGQVAQNLLSNGLDIYYPVEEMLAQRDNVAFYPLENFHSDGMINHLFAKGFLSRIGIEVAPEYAEGASIQTVWADIGMLGFKRQADIWTYPYERFAVSSQRRKPKWIKQFFPRALDFGSFEAQRPASERRALIISNSFGKYLAPHFAPGFRQVFHINADHAEITKIRPALRRILEELSPTDVIFLVHDGGIMTPKIKRFADALQQELKRSPG